jgi:hypothetical protein
LQNKVFAYAGSATEADFAPDRDVLLKDAAAILGH